MEKKYISFKLANLKIFQFLSNNPIYIYIYIIYIYMIVCECVCVYCVCVYVCMYQKSSFLFLNPVSFYRNYLKNQKEIGPKQKGTWSSYTSLFRLPHKFRSFISLVIYHLVIFDVLIQSKIVPKTITFHDVMIILLLTFSLNL